MDMAVDRARDQIHAGQIERDRVQVRLVLNSTLHAE
jgi:hypothetical protein